MTEHEFELHICKKLEVCGWRSIPHIDPTHAIDGVGLLSYLRTTENWQKLTSKLGEDNALAQVIASLDKQYTESSFQFFRRGLTVDPEGVHIDMLNAENWSKNQFTFLRQIRHSADNRELRGDIALWVNGLPLGFIELKNGQTGQGTENAIAQIVDRVKRQEAPKLFQRIIFALAMDTRRASLSIDPSATKNFRPFNPDRNYTAPQGELQTAYIYSGETSFLHPANVTELLSHFLYVDTKKKELVFPRFHQWEGAKLLKRLCVHAYEDDGMLGERFLFQHSPGSGKSKTISWAARFLVTTKLSGGGSLFDKILIVTDRRNLDSQIQRDLEPLLGKSQVTQAQSAKHLEELLSTNCSVPVITTTVQKFLDLGELKYSTDERVCIIIDEAHRSQDGELHDKMRQTIVAEFDKSGYDETEFSLFALQQATQTKNNTVTIAFTATPSGKTLQQYGKDGQPHHLYSMRQAIEEGYILNPLKNVITYETLFQLHQKGFWHLTLKEYPAALLSKQLSLAAYESPDIITAKSDIITAIIKERTAHAIGGRGKAMLVCSSKKSAMLFQKALRQKLSDYEIKPLIAFTGTVEDGAVTKTETSINAETGATQSIEKTFESDLAYRILVVVNKFQTGFDEPLLHTLFIDKSVAGINAVQTISRVNRCMEGKEDTLVVDFTNSYDEIAKAFKMFIDLPQSFSAKIVAPADLEEKFQTVVEESGIAASEWEPDFPLDGDAGMAELDNLCARIADKIKAGGQPTAPGAIKSLLDDLTYLATKGLLTRYKIWQWRKLVLKGVYGYLIAAGPGVKPSMEEIRESVAAVGMAVALERIGEGEISLPVGNCGATGHGVLPKELSLAEAIHTLNQRNFEKLTAQIHGIQQKKEALLAGEKTTVKEQLEQFCDLKQESLLVYAGNDTADPAVVAQHLLKEADELRENLDTPRASGEIIKAWLALEVRELRLRKLEAAFYACHSRLKAVSEATMLEATRIEEKLAKG